MAFTGGRREWVLAWWVRLAVGVVLIFAVVNWVGWASGIDALTRGLPGWPRMTPWSALLLAALGVAIVVQSGNPSRARVRAGCVLAVVPGVLALMFLGEYVSGRSLPIDEVFFAEAVRELQVSWPGRPSPRTALSVSLLSIGVALTRVDRNGIRVVRAVCVAASAMVAAVAVLGYSFNAVSVVGISRSTGMGISTASGLLILVAATLLSRPDRNPLAWLLARPDRGTLIRLAGILAGLPLVVGISRFVFLQVGLRGDAVWVLSIGVGTVVVGLAVFFSSQREQRLLIERESLSRERAEAERKRADAESERAQAEARYRILADNSVDVVLHIRGAEVVWISPSVQAAFGDPPQNWIGSDFLSHIHPDDVDAIAAAMQKIADERAVVTPRFRVMTADGGYHWVDGHGKAYIDSEGNVDGATGSMRVVDDKVEAERKLQRLARFDTLTGLVNRAETLARLESALAGSRRPGEHLGVLFCDVDHFKAVNDTWGHAAGDTILSTLATRISECVRHGDTVGRTGGDEILVLLPGLHSLGEAAQTAEKIRARAAEPIQQSGQTVQATLSIGATLAVPGESVLTLTARVDSAMYRAKREGRNRVTRI